MRFSMVQVMAVLLAVLATAVPAYAKKNVPNRAAMKSLNAAVESYHRADFDGAMERFNRAIAVRTGRRPSPTGPCAAGPWGQGRAAGAPGAAPSTQDSRS